EIFLANPGGRRLPAKVTPPLRTTHQSIDPRNTPSVTRRADAHPDDSARPRPANMAANEIIVAGLTIVSAKVAATVPSRSRPPTEAGRAVAWARSPLAPSQSMNPPPRRRSGISTIDKAAAKAAKPNAARAA